MTFIIKLLCNNYYTISYQRGDLLQTVYVDVLIFLNIIIDFFILLSLKTVFNIDVTNKRLVISSIIISIFSLLALIPQINFILNIIINILTAAASVFIGFGKCSIANFIKRVCVFFAINFIFAGIMIAIYMLFKPSRLAIINNVVYFDISPLLLIILTLCCYIILYIFKRIAGKQGVMEKIYRVHIKVNDKSYSFFGKVDTGCDVKEPFSGAPVIIVEKSVFNDLKIDDYNYRIIPFSSLGGEGILNGIKAQEVIIGEHKIEKDIYIGLCENIFNGEIKALIPNDIFGVDIL